jgi:hypothetical protein
MYGNHARRPLPIASGTPSAVPSRHPRVEPDHDEEAGRVALALVGARMTPHDACLDRRAG